MSQTDPVDGVEDAELVHDLTGTTDHGVIDALTAFLAAEGWTVARKHLDGERKGYARPSDRSVVVEVDVAPSKPPRPSSTRPPMSSSATPTTWPGTGSTAGPTRPRPSPSPTSWPGMLGFDTSAYSIGYIAEWADCDPELVKNTATRVLAAAHHIAAVLDPDDPHDTPAAA
nr:hypothetical protein [Clavibacter michiganensis]